MPLERIKICCRVITTDGKCNVGWIGSSARPPAVVDRSSAGGSVTARSPGRSGRWRIIDIVSIDYYGYFNRRSDYVRDLQKIPRFGKPVTIAECGTCAYKGAPQRGGWAWDAVDYNKDPQEIMRGLVRSEQTQAR